MTEEQMHRNLPIGEQEKVLAIITHHWVAYAIIYIGVGTLVLAIFAAVVAVISNQETWNLSSANVNALTAGGLFMALLVAAFGAVPLSMRKQEAMVLTEEALVLLEKPSLFGNKISQLNLQHIADVTVHQDTVGAILGYATLVIETPGEQNNYRFKMVGKPRERAKQIIEAHENYSAALESGRIQTTLGQQPPVNGVSWQQPPAMSPNPPQAPPPTMPTAPGDPTQPSQGS